MATQEEVRIKTGMDNSAIAGGLVDLQRQVDKSTGSIKNSLKGLKSFGVGLGLANIFNIGDTISDTVTSFINRGKDLGTFWGAFSVGGMKAVQQLGQVERAAEKLRQKLHEVNKTRFDLDQKEKEFQFEQKTAEEKILDMENQVLDLLEKQQVYESKSVEFAELENKMRAIRIEQGKIELDLEKKKSEERARAAQRDIENQKKAADLRKEAARLEAERASQPGKFKKQKQGFADDDLREFMPTIEELAKSGRFVGRGRAARFVSGQGAREAQDFINAKNAAVQDFNRYGLDDETKRKFQELQSLKSPLQKLGILPADERIASATEEAAKNTAETTKKLDQIYSELYE